MLLDLNGLWKSNATSTREGSTALVNTIRTRQLCDSPTRRRSRPGDDRLPESLPVKLTRTQRADKTESRSCDPLFCRGRRVAPPHGG